MKLIIIIILASILFTSSCGSRYPFNPHTIWLSHKNIETTNSKLEDLSKYKAYYRIVFRDEDRLEEIVSGNNISISEKVHITDLQYVLIKNDMSKFIIISSIPTRNVSKSCGYYLDRNYNSYKDSINLNRVKMINYGNIVNESLVNIFRDGTENRNIKFEIKDEILKFKFIYYPGRKKLSDQVIQLADLLPNEYITFHKMSDNFVLKYDYVENNKNLIDVFKKEIVFLHLINGKNMIKFNYVDSGSMYFKEQGSRFNLLYP